MGACVLCNKSAGLFNSLHKRCYQQYQQSTDIIVELIATYLNSSTAQLAIKVANEVNRLPFVEEARERTLVRALEKYAQTRLHSEEMNAFAQPWSDLLEQLAPREELFLEQHFLAQQKNLAALVSLRNGQLPECNMNTNLVHLGQGENLRWCFRQAYVEPPEKQTANQNWSVALQLAKNMLPKNKRKSKQDTVECRELWVTDQRLFFENDINQAAIHYGNIYSVSPVKQGVSIQLNQKDTLPKTIICEDGKLLYALIHYVRDSQ